MRNNMVEQIQNGSLIKSDFWPGVAGDPREIFLPITATISTMLKSILTMSNVRKKLKLRDGVPLQGSLIGSKKNFPSKKDFSMEYLCDGVAYRETRRVRCDYYITVDDYVSAKSGKTASAMHIIRSTCTSMKKYRPKRASNTSGYGTYSYYPAACADCRRARPFSLLRVGASQATGSQTALRVKAPCMAMGQAAGSAAALALRYKTDVRNIDIHELKTALSDSGCIVP